MSVAVWLNYHFDVCDSPGMWDQSMIKSMLDAYGVEHWAMDTDQQWPDVDRPVVVIPGGFHVDDIPRINMDLARFTAVLVIITSDERSLFPYERLAHPDMHLWVMTPRPDRGPADQYLGEGWQPRTPEILDGYPGPGDRPEPWVFAGQINHERRQAMAHATAALTGDLAATPDRWLPTAGFTRGLDQDAYLALLRSAKVVLAPSGPATPDSFRLYEALEAGCIPIADALCPGYDTVGYWETLFGCPVFPVIHEWRTLPGMLDETLAGWPANANRVFAWWIRYKRDLFVALADELTRLDGVPRAGQITVLMPTSPIPSHPDTTVIEATVASVRERLPDAEIILMVDGVRPEQEHRRADYEQYARRLLWLANHQWRNVYPLRFDDHRHQASMTRSALDHVRTPLVLFIEHDTPLEGDIPFEDLTHPILDGHADLIRFHHESEILEVHRYLMLDTEPQDVAGVPLMRTMQWSQRPHLASAAYYRDIISHYFGHAACTMIEDVMHGIVKNSVEADPLAWNRHRLWIYTPEGNIRRSHHTDGRGLDPKFDMTFAYDGPTPEGAPAPGRR